MTTTGPKLRLNRFLPYRLSIASNLVSDLIASAYEALFGLRIPEWRLIAVIAERGPITQLDIGRATRMDKVTVSRAAIALADRGLIERSPNPADQRSHLLALSPAGRQLYAQVAPKALEIEARLLAALTLEERDQLHSALGKLEASALDLAGQPSAPPARSAAIRGPS